MSLKKARAKRVEAISLLSYELYDSPDGDPVLQRVGRTLNISQTGLLLETERAIEDGQFITVEFGIEENLIRAKGELVYSRCLPGNKFEHGIRFTRVERHSFDILSEYIKQFRVARDERLASLGTVSKGLGNSVFIASGEHKIILIHLDSLKKTIKDPDPEVAPIQIHILLDLLYKDLSNHFHLEEDVLFAAGLSCDPPANLKKLIEHLKKEHSLILQNLERLTNLVKTFVNNKIAFDQMTIHKVDKMINFIKHHCKLEIVSLFPEIDKNERCRGLIRELADRS